MPFSAIACTRSSRGTNSGTIALQAGAVSAEPMPMAKVSASSQKAVIACGDGEHRQRDRGEDRPELRADQEHPPIDDVGQRTAGKRQQEHRHDGRRLHHRDDERLAVRGVVISHPAPVFCSQVPSHAITLASHRLRKVALRSGSRAAGRRIGPS